MKHYIEALFFRYCDLFCAVHDNIDKALDNPLFYARQTLEEELAERLETAHIDPHEHYDSYRSTSVRVSPQHVLKSEYFYEGELLFFFQLNRLRLSVLLQQQYVSDPIILRQSPSEEQLAATNKKLLQLFTELAVHPCIKKYIIEKFKRQVMSVYVYHGERERYVRRHPTASCTPNDVLTACRPNDHMNAVSMQKTTLGDIVSKLLEREIVLIAQHATHQWLKLEEVKEHKAINKCFVIEELLAIDALEELVTRNELKQCEIPVLLRLVSVYYVLYRGGVYRAKRFVDAYMVWHSLLIEQWGHVPLRAIHEIIRDDVQYFCTTLSTVTGSTGGSSSTGDTSSAGGTDAGANAGTTTGGNGRRRQQQRRRRQQ
jgi:hypothetical protein